MQIYAVYVRIYPTLNTVHAAWCNTMAFVFCFCFYRRPLRLFNESGTDEDIPNHRRNQKKLCKKSVALAPVPPQLYKTPNNVTQHDTNSSRKQTIHAGDIGCSRGGHLDQRPLNVNCIESGNVGMISAVEASVACDIDLQLPMSHALPSEGNELDNSSSATVDNDMLPDSGEAAAASQQQASNFTPSSLTGPDSFGIHHPETPNSSGQQITSDDLVKSPAVVECSPCLIPTSTRQSLNSEHTVVQPIGSQKRQQLTLSVCNRQASTMGPQSATANSQFHETPTSACRLQAERVIQKRTNAGMYSLSKLFVDNIILLMIHSNKQIAYFFLNF